jgi:isoleucyl-tRNA synthetase
VVHTAPSHGAEDFITGMKYGLDATSNVDEKGILRNGLPEYTGKRVWDANQPIIELVRSRGALLHTEKTEHSYPHCWRCHNPVIFRATEQWFISMETPMPGGAGKNDTLRSRTLQEIKKVKWDPAWGEERLSNMIETRPDWCISRQRVWGVPIAVFLCEGCGKPIRESSSYSGSPGLMRGSRRNRTTFFRRGQSARIAAARNSRKRPISSTCGWSPARVTSPS